MRSKKTGAARRLAALVGGLCAILVSSAPATRVGAATTAPATLVWRGVRWNVKSGAGKNPGRNNWSASNAFVDASGDLHLAITNVGGTWSCAEIWTTGVFGLGTFQWQVKTAVDNLDPNVVLGLFAYGPPSVGPDGTNEIDIEYSRFGATSGDNQRWTVWPNLITSPPLLGRTTQPVSLGADPSTTSRFTRSSDSVSFTTLAGLQPVGSSVNVLDAWTYQPTDATTTVSPYAMPVHLNLWLYGGAPPTDGQNVEVVVHDFSFTAATSAVPALPRRGGLVLAACLLGVGALVAGRSLARATGSGSRSRGG